MSKEFTEIVLNHEKTGLASSSRNEVRSISNSRPCSIDIDSDTGSAVGRFSTVVLLGLCFHLDKQRCGLVSFCLAGIRPESFKGCAFIGRLGRHRGGTTGSFGLH